ncbi:hypothetical protein [Actinokineospora sp. HUAS TT18]|uniref:hypothetical protein n=1 Tax=Actinokineospora sp. HUAS TT18 TaxID=3447451 RepID=UPI003F525DD6
MHVTPTLTRAAAAVAAVAGLSLAAAPQAAAVTSATIESCESGASQFYCFASATDIVGTATVRWYLNGTLYTALNDKWFTGLRPCRVTGYNVRVVVTDAVAQKEDSYFIPCNSGPWP